MTYAATGERAGHCRALAAFVLAAAAVFVGASSASALTLSLREGSLPDAGYNVLDNDIRNGHPNPGANPRWNVGHNNFTYRQAIEFPLEPYFDGIVSSVTLTVYYRGDGYNGTQTQVDLHRLTTDFSNDNTITWNSPWNVSGGDYGTPILSSVTPSSVVDGTVYTFNSTSNFVAAVQNSLDGDGTLRLLLKANNESSSFAHLMSFHSSETPTVAFRPILTVTYEVPEPASLALLALGGVMMFRRRQSTR